jgi:hypothetical protein
MQRKVFTVDEANSLIPIMAEVFRSIDLLKSKIRDSGRKMEVLKLLWDDTVAESGNPDYQDYVSHKTAIDKDVGEIERMVREEIIRRGIRFPVGGIESGLVDFPTVHEGRWVYLCWQNGEDELRYWHETNSGFPGRQQITDEQRRTMGQDGDTEGIDDSALDF